MTFNDAEGGEVTVKTLDDGRLEVLTDNRVWLSPDDARTFASEVTRLANVADDVFAGRPL